MSEQVDELGRWAELFDLPLGETAPEPEVRRRGIFSRLKESLTKPSQTISPQLAGIFAPGLITQETWDDLEEALIGADCGMDASLALVEELRSEAMQGRIVNRNEIAKGLVAAVTRQMTPEPPKISLDADPTVILVVGVNGSGKTTTVGKLAHRLHQLDQKVVIGAADTFRAAAIDQLAIWADRSDAHLVRQAPGADPGAVAFDAVSSGVSRQADVVLIDTAGRLQTQHNLMEELRKVHAVIAKANSDAPHETLLVLDATTGQNGLSQARLFGQAVPLTGVIVTKLDGSAKGGIAVAINRELGIPVKMIGVGEQLDDLQPFNAQAYAQALFSPEPSPS